MDRKTRKQLKTMKEMIDFIKTAKELDGLLSDFKGFDFVKNVRRMTEAVKKYAPSDK